jgi:hypothetical protein
LLQNKQLLAILIEGEWITSHQYSPAVENPLVIEFVNPS